MPTTLIQNASEIQLNDQQEIDQILGHPPNWLLRWGMTLLLAATIIFGILAWLIKYPDIITAEVQILTENPAIRVIPIANGKLENLWVDNQQFVEKGSLLALVESTANYQDVLLLETVLEEIEQVPTSKDYLKINCPNALVLGSMQGQYARLVQKVEDYQHYLGQYALFHKIETLEEQIAHTRQINLALKQQQNTLKKEVAIVLKNYHRNKKLHQSNVISDLDLEQIESNYLQSKRQLNGFKTQMINNNVQIDQLQSQIIDLKQSRKDGRTTKELSIKESVQSLKSEIINWQQNYLIQAPIAGKVNLNNIWSNKQYIKAGEALLTIVPQAGAGKIIAKAKLPIANSGKVKKGHQVNIQLNAYPYQEYGIIKSEVTLIALIPQEENYQIELEMPDSLVTTYDKKIPFAQEMKGVANIITEDRSILQRIFDRMWSIIKNS